MSEGGMFNRLYSTVDSDVGPTNTGGTIIGQQSSKTEYQAFGLLTLKPASLYGIQDQVSRIKYQALSFRLKPLSLIPKIFRPPSIQACKLLWYPEVNGQIMSESV